MATCQQSPNLAGSKLNYICYMQNVKCLSILMKWILSESPLLQLSECGQGHCTRYNQMLQEGNISAFMLKFSVYFHYESSPLQRQQQQLLSLGTVRQYNQSITHSQSFSHKSSHLTFSINRQRPWVIVTRVAQRHIPLSCSQKHAALGLIGVPLVSQTHLLCNYGYHKAK